MSGSRTPRTRLARQGRTPVPTPSEPAAESRARRGAREVMWSTVVARASQWPHRAPSRAITPATTMPGRQCTATCHQHPGRKPRADDPARVRLMHHRHLADQHPDRVPETDPVQRTEVRVQDEHRCVHRASPPFGVGAGAAGRSRTGGLHHGKVALCQLSYNRMRAIGEGRTPVAPVPGTCSTTELPRRAYRGRELGAEDSNRHDPGQSRAAYR